MTTVLYNSNYLHPDELTGILEYETKVCGIVNNNPVGRRAVPQETFELYRDNDRTLRVFVKTPDLDIVNLAGAVGVLTIKPNKDATSPIITKRTTVPTEGQIGAADMGEMYFFIVPADTVTLDIQQYVFSVNVSLSNSKTYTVLEGTINLLQPVG